MAPTAKKRTPLRARARGALSAPPTAQTPAKSSRDAISHPRSTYTPEESYKPNKKEKVALRHERLLSKVRSGGISKPGVGSAGGSGNGVGRKRRRPGKKMAAVESLGGLGEALPELEEGEGSDEWEGLSSGSDVGGEGGDGVGDVEVEALPEGMRKARKRGSRKGGAEGKMVMKSLRHRPGAMKRKREVELKEVQRMRGNLVEMAKRDTRGEGVAGGDGGKGGGDGSGVGASQAERWKALRAFIGGTMEVSGEFGGKKG
ncbi:hypothetical protein MBLNU230_g5549t1 [Neophaeotheca triangularis]